MTHHNLDPWPIPKEKAPLYINEPRLIDESLRSIEQNMDIDPSEDNIRVYVPLDINRDAIIRRLNHIVYRYGEANEDNEMEFSIDVDMIISQLEIYDQLWFVREGPAKNTPVRNSPKTNDDEEILYEEGNHSNRGISLAEEIIKILEDIPDGCAEMFPFDAIDELSREYLGEPREP